MGALLSGYMLTILFASLFAWSFVQWQAERDSRDKLSKTLHQCSNVVLTNDTDAPLFYQDGQMFIDFNNRMKLGPCLSYFQGNGIQIRHTYDDDFSNDGHNGDRRLNALGCDPVVASASVGSCRVSANVQTNNQCPKEQCRRYEHDYQDEDILKILHERKVKRSEDWIRTGCIPTDTGGNCMCWQFQHDNDRMELDKMPCPPPRPCSTCDTISELGGRKATCGQNIGNGAVGDDGKIGCQCTFDSNSNNDESSSKEEKTKGTFIKCPQNNN